MKITWVINSAITRLPSGELTSSHAHIRKRVLIPSNVLGRVGYHNQILTLLSDQLREEAFEALEGHAVIFSESLYLANEKLADYARKQGIKVILDLTQDVFGKPAELPFYEPLLRKADIVTCNTSTLAERLRKQSDRTVSLVEDPYESYPGPPVFAPGETMQLLWFGSPHEVRALVRAAPSLLQADRAVHLTVMTQLTTDVLELCRDFPLGDHFTVRLLPWSLDAQWKAIADCDAVILPRLHTEEDAVRSHSRMVEPLRMGKPVIAQPVPAYEPFRPWVWLGEDLHEGMEWLMSSSAKIPFLIQMAQDYIERNLSPQIAAAEWERVLLGGMH